MRLAAAPPGARPEAQAATASDGAAAAAVPKWQGLTCRAVVLGLGIGTLTTVENIYFAIKCVESARRRA